jgi:uncharacterized protein YbjT (DUF2867 family)
LRVAVIGGTGLVGRRTVDALRELGHDPVAVSRSGGVDVVSGAGLDAALAGVDAVVDTTNTAAADAAAARDFFAATTANLLAAERRAGVGHHVVLSILGLDRLEGNAHYAGKRRQEEVALAGDAPVTVMRAAQFHEFAGQVVDWTRQGDAATVPPALVQPVAASDVGRALAEVAIRPPQGRAPDLAGPEPQDLFDMARRTLAARGQALRLIPSWRDGPFGVEYAGEIMLPGPGARIAPTTFDAWLASFAD